MLVARSLRSLLPLSVTCSLLAALVALVAPGCGAGTAPLVVTTTEGDVQGTLSEDEVIRAFLGVPYAAPPTGPRRFLPPAAALPHEDTLQATDFGPSCPGTRTPLDLVLRPRPADEDCLSLNIWTQAERGRRPVMLFLHGGGYVNGASNIPVYDGADLARNGDVVVVSINYRLAALGFLSTEALQAERAELDGGAGNMGILDMLAALRWVQANIRAFGGDPDNVTIFGESAGGSAVCSLLAATGAEGLFHRGIIQSGGCSATPLRGGSRGTFDVGDTLVERLGCTGEGELECLRALTTQEILDAVMEDASGLGFAPYGPAVDGATFSDSPAQLLADGVGVDVPLMVGSNLNEMTVFLLGSPRPASAAAMRDQFLAAVGNDEEAADALMELYDVTTTEDAERAFEVFATDRSFACNALSIAETAASAGREVYLYEFQHVVGNQASTFGVGHGFELPYVFGTLDRFSLFSTMRGEREDRTVTRAQTAWSSFARDGVPEFEGGWPRFTTETHQYMGIDDPSAVDDAFRQDRCAALEELGLSVGVL